MLYYIPVFLADGVEVHHDGLISARTDDACATPIQSTRHTGNRNVSKKADCQTPQTHAVNTKCTDPGVHIHNKWRGTLYRRREARALHGEGTQKLKG